MGTINGQIRGGTFNDIPPGSVLQWHYSCYGAVAKDAAQTATRHLDYLTWPDVTCRGLHASTDRLRLASVAHSSVASSSDDIAVETKDSDIGKLLVSVDLY